MVEFTLSNGVWVGDITYEHFQDGWLYLAVWLDWCSRKVVDWEVRETVLEDLVYEALRRPLSVRHHPVGLTAHRPRQLVHGSRS